MYAHLLSTQSIWKTVKFYPISYIQVQNVAMHFSYAHFKIENITLSINFVLR